MGNFEISRQVVVVVAARAAMTDSEEREKERKPLGNFCVIWIRSNSNKGGPLRFVELYPFLDRRVALALMQSYDSGVGGGICDGGLYPSKPGL